MRSNKHFKFNSVYMGNCTVEFMAKLLVTEMAEQSEHWTEQCEKENFLIVHEKTKLMLLTLARRRVLGHKVPRLRHLYKPIKIKINPYLNNSQKIFNTNYRRNSMIF